MARFLQHLAQIVCHLYASVTYVKYLILIDIFVYDAVLHAIVLAEIQHGEPNMDVIPAALSVPTAAKYIGISRANMYRLIKAGAIVPAKVGHRTVIRRADADAFLESCLTRPSNTLKARSVSEKKDDIFG